MLTCMFAFMEKETIKIVNFQDDIQLHPLRPLLVPSKFEELLTQFV